MVKVIFHTVFMLLIGFQTMAATQPDSLFSQANKAYNEGYFQESVDMYQMLIESGYESVDLYFNMGNASFKIDDIPSAIYYFEKAKKLAPTDEDILFNLGMANTLIVDKIEPVPEMFYKSWWKSFLNLLPADAWAIFAIVTFTLFFVMLAIYLLSKRIRIRKVAFFTGVFVLFLAIFTFLLAQSKYNQMVAQNEAIVFTPTITVKSSPNPNSVDLFVIHEGAKIKILDQVGDWVEIKIASGSVGWLPVSSMKII